MILIESVHHALFGLNTMSCAFIHLPRFVSKPRSGIVPNKFFITRVRKFVSWLNSWYGIVPFKLASSIVNVIRLGTYWARFWGILPDNRVESIIKCIKLGRLGNRLESTLPAKSTLFRILSRSSWYSFDNWVGSSPVNLLYDRLKFFKFERFPSEAGIVEESSFRSKSSVSVEWWVIYFVRYLFA